MPKYIAIKVIIVANPTLDCIIVILVFPSISIPLLLKLCINEALKNEDIKIEISGKTYKPKYRECKSGYIDISTSHTNTGIILVPDSCILTEDMEEKKFLADIISITNCIPNIEWIIPIISGNMKNVLSKDVIIDGYNNVIENLGEEALTSNCTTYFSQNYISLFIIWTFCKLL